MLKRVSHTWQVCSIMKPCNYWNANTLPTVADNGCDELSVENNLQILINNS